MSERVNAIKASSVEAYTRQSAGPDTVTFFKSFSRKAEFAMLKQEALQRTQQDKQAALQRIQEDKLGVRLSQSTAEGKTGSTVGFLTRVTGSKFVLSFTGDEGGILLAEPKDPSRESNAEEIARFFMPGTQNGEELVSDRPDWKDGATAETWFLGENSPFRVIKSSRSNDPGERQELLHLLQDSILHETDLRAQSRRAEAKVQEDIDTEFGYIAADPKVIYPVLGESDLFTEADEKRIQELEARYEKVASLPGQIKELRDEKIGTGLYARYKEDGVDKIELIGVALKITDNPNERQHVIVFTNGQSFKVRPTDLASITKYEHYLQSPDPDRSITAGFETAVLDEYGNLREDIPDTFIRRIPTLGISVKASGNKIDQRAEVIDATDKAIANIDTIRRNRQIEDFKKAVFQAEQPGYNQTFDEVVADNGDIFSPGTPEDKASEANTHGDSSENIIANVESRANIMYGMHESLPQLDREGFGVRYLVENTETKESELFGLGFLFMDEGVAKALIVTKGDMFVVTSKNQKNDAITKYFVRENIDITIGLNSVEYRNRMNTIPHHAEIVKAFYNKPDSDKKVEFASDSEEGTDQEQIIRAITIVQSDIEKSRTKRQSNGDFQNIVTLYYGDNDVASAPPDQSAA